jgi:phospholipid-binding lipoprotein MlaA
LLRFFIITITAILLQSYASFAAATHSKISDLDDAEFDIPSSQNSLQINDPLEKYNRKVHAFNDYFDRHIFRHVAIGYRNTLPGPVRQSIRNFITNIYLPISLFNSILQGKVDNSLATLSNFLINTTLGVGGLLDVAGSKNIHYRQEDFGQTLGHYNFSSGIYLVIPFLGPSSVRDFSGFIVDKSINPLDFDLVEYNGQENVIRPEYRVALSSINAIDIRENLLGLLDDVNNDSFDPYATIRSAYLQKRLNDIKN